MHWPFLTNNKNDSYVSPRTRAKRTLELLGLGCRKKYPWQEEREPETLEPVRTDATVTVTDAIQEWDYGVYEGLTSKQIKDLRAKNGQGMWNIWKEGCPGGE